MKKVIVLFSFLLMLGISVGIAHAANNTSLEITKFYFPSIVKVNQSTEVFGEVTNIGNYNGTKVSAKLTGINDSWIQNISNNFTANIENGSTLSPAFTLEFPEIGVYSLTLITNASNANVTNSTKAIEVVNENYLIVEASKSANTLNYSVSSVNSAYEDEEVSINVKFNNTGKLSIDLIHLKVEGVDPAYVISKPTFKNLGVNNTTDGNIVLKIPNKGKYDVRIIGIAKYNVSVLNGSTSYEAFTQTADINATWWGFPYNSYFVNQIDNLGGGLEQWVYEKNGLHAMCGVGCTGGLGCPQGDMLMDRDRVELKFGTYSSDWLSFTESGLATIPLEIKEKEIIQNFGGGGSISTPRNHLPELEPIEDMEIEVGEVLSFIAQASDPDGDELTYSDNTKLFDINSQTGKIYFMPGNAQVGEHNITITVSDGKLEDSESFLLNITEKPTEPVQITEELETAQPEQEIEDTGITTGFMTIGLVEITGIALLIIGALSIIVLFKYFRTKLV